MQFIRKYRYVTNALKLGVLIAVLSGGCSTGSDNDVADSSADIWSSFSEVSLRDDIAEVDSLWGAGNIVLMESGFHRLLQREPELTERMGTKEHAMFYEALAKFHYRLGNLTEAQHCSELAISRLDSIEDVGFKRAVWNNRALIESDLGNHEAALKLLFKSMDIYGADTLNKAFADLYNNIGTVYVASGDYGLAIQYFEKLMALAKALDLTGEFGYYHGNMGDIYYHMGQYEQSISHLKEAKALFAKHNQFDEELFVTTLLASNYTALGRIDEAEQLLQGNLGKAEDQKLWETYVETTISLFDLHLARGDDRAALAALDDGLEKVHITNTALLRPRIYDKLVDYYRGKGDFKTAFTYRRQRNGIRDSAFTISKSQLMHELTVKYETERKNDQIAQLETLNERERRTNVIYLAGLALLVSILTVIFWLLKRLSVQKNALEEANRTKDRLFSIIAHDLRSPMVALRGMGNLMHHYIDKKDERKLLDLGNKTGETLTRINHLLDNLLNWAVTNSKQIAYNPVAHDTFTLLDDALSVHRAAATAKGVRLQTEVSDSMVSVDLNMASSVLRNLISNAIKYSPTGGTITIAGQVDSSHYKISIRDEGGGIPQHVIDALHRSEEALVSGGGKESFGLGLRLAMYFAKKGRGRVVIRNGTKGAIAEFYVPLMN